MTIRLLIPLVMMIAWAAMTGSLGLPNLLLGLGLGLVALWLVRGSQDMARIRVHPLRLIRLIGVFFVELIKSGWRVLVLVMRHDLRLDPGIVAVPLRVTRDFEITLLANLITLTPGTLTVDLSDDRRYLYVHCLDMPDADAVIADIRDGFERLILETFA